MSDDLEGVACRARLEVASLSRKAMTIQGFKHRGEALELGSSAPSGVSA